ncbi:MAG: hypothetical protein AB1762_18150 [Gemmatimonadota bacterium]
MTDSDLQRDYQRAVELRVSDERMRCPTPEAIEVLVVGSGSEAVRLTTLDHVMACAQCRREFELLRAIRAAGSPRRAISPRWYALAAVVLLAVALTLVNVNRNAPTMRGPGVSGDMPVTISPIGEVDVSTARRLIWRAFPNAAQYRVELVDPAGGMRASVSTVDTSWSLPQSVSIQSGETLQWTVEAILPDARRLASGVTEFRVR